MSTDPIQAAIRSLREIQGVASVDGEADLAELGGRLSDIYNRASAMQDWLRSEGNDALEQMRARAEKAETERDKLILDNSDLQMQLENTRGRVGS